MKTGNWKAKDALPDLNEKRAYHSSCALENSVYVIGGSCSNDGDYSELDDIEVLSMRLNKDLSFAFLS